MTWIKLPCWELDLSSLDQTAFLSNHHKLGKNICRQKCCLQGRWLALSLCLYSARIWVRLNHRCPLQGRWVHSVWDRICGIQLRYPLFLHRVKNTLLSFVTESSPCRSETLSREYFIMEHGKICPASLDKSFRIQKRWQQSSLTESYIS